MALKSLLRDARNLQILWLGTFLTYGILYLDWHANLVYYLCVLTGAVGTQSFFIWRKGFPIHSLKSAIITALGLCLLLKVNHPLFGTLAGALAIGSKFYLRRGNKHIFNPANFGIVAIILLTGQAWISPGQWGNEVVTLFLIASCGMLVTLKVGRWDAGLSFYLTLFICEFVRGHLYQGWPLDHIFHSFSSGTLVLFAFFMITDPMTSPNARNGRIIWGSMLAVIAFVLSNFMQLYTAPMWALFGWSMLTPVFDKLFVKPKFNWL